MATRVREPGIPAGGSSSDPVAIRAMTADDLPRVLEIERAAFTVPWTPATFHALVARPDAHLWVAEVADEGIVGYAAVWIVADQAELGDIAVTDPWRRRGIGTRLIGCVFDRVREHGVRELFLEVRVSNENARRLYEAHGFRLVGRRPGYYARPKEDALVMRKVIGGIEE